MEETGIRLNKYLSEAGICSRREADRMVEEGRVTVNGELPAMGQKILPGDQVEVDGTMVGGKDRPVLLLVNKPAGIVCTTAEFKGEKNIVDMVNYPVRVYPVGRLDKESEGLILMTNRGELVNKILRGGNHHEKEYLVTVNRPVTPEFLEAMSRGVPILDTVTAPCKTEKTGYRVVALKRIRVMEFTLDGIPSGGYREATEAEQRELERRLKNSSGRPYRETHKHK